MSLQAIADVTSPVLHHGHDPRVVVGRLAASRRKHLNPKQIITSRQR